MINKEAILFTLLAVGDLDMIYSYSKLDALYTFLPIISLVVNVGP